MDPPQPVDDCVAQRLRPFIDEDLSMVFHGLTTLGRPHRRKHPLHGAEAVTRDASALEARRERSAVAVAALEPTISPS